MKIHYLQHVPFENLASIEPWAKSKQHTVACTQLYGDDPLPSIHEIDWLVVMGGPMNVYEDERYPWLMREKKFIELAIQHNKTVLGICLGAQLIAHVLGSKIYANRCKEIGWYPVELTIQGQKMDLFNQFPPSFTTFHWHGDTFDLPAGAVHLASSDVCSNQAFSYNSTVIGLQFHLESTQDSIEQLLIHCEHECITGGKRIQTPAEIRIQERFIPENNRLLRLLLDQLETVTLNNQINKE